MIEALLAICLSVVSISVMGFLFYMEREHKDERRSLTNKALAKSTQELMELTATDLHKSVEAKANPYDDLVPVSEADSSLFDRMIADELKED